VCLGLSVKQVFTFGTTSCLCSYNHLKCRVVKLNSALIDHLVAYARDFFLDSSYKIQQGICIESKELLAYSVVFGQKSMDTLVFDRIRSVLLISKCLQYDIGTYFSRG